MKRKVWLGILMLTVMGIAETAAQSGAADTYFICPKTLGPVYWTLAEQGAKTAGKELGVDVIFNGPSEAVSSKQINMIEDMLSKGIQGLAISPNDAQAIKPLIADAIDEGVTVVTFDSDAPESKRAYYIGPASDQQNGKDMADYIAKKIDYRGQIAFMCGGLAAENQVATMNAAKEELSKYPDITVVATLPSNNDMQKSYENATTLIKTYPNLKGILGFTGGQPPAAAEVIEQAIAAGELKKGQIIVTGVGFPSNCRKYIKSGTLEQIFSWESEKLGYTSVHVIHRLRNKQPIESGVTLPKIGKLTVEGQRIWTGMTIVTADNVDQFTF
ncbi:MAG: autoinducer 2 ABC transporter substrate-binding protein [Synergistaceae bacterium]|jgi:ABC-type sugar transport system substrate-binding protein|nr:autoinducer 2 ABC transporter substrate-binding protein [Synergistaceae bacterium]